MDLLDMVEDLEPCRTMAVTEKLSVLVRLHVGTVTWLQIHCPVK